MLKQIDVPLYSCMGKTMQKLSNISRNQSALKVQM